MYTRHNRETLKKDLRQMLNQNGFRKGFNSLLSHSGNQKFPQIKL